MIKERAESFIRDTLGCQCPAELFQELGQETELSEGPLFRAFRQHDSAMSPVIDRIFSVGGRLLVVVARVRYREAILRLLEAGLSVRDSMGFNRFRLVIFSPVEIPHEDVAVPSHLDDRVHLHVIASCLSIPPAIKDEGGQ